MRNLILIAAAVLTLTACGKAELGADCTESDQCAEGTQCVPYGAFVTSGGEPTCDANTRICSITCNGDAECTTALGSGHICLTDCGLGSCVVGSRG